MIMMRPLECLRMWSAFVKYTPPSGEICRGSLHDSHSSSECLRYTRRSCRPMSRTVKEKKIRMLPIVCSDVLLQGDRVTPGSSPVPRDSA